MSRRSFYPGFTALASFFLLGASGGISRGATQEFPDETMREFSQVFAIIRENYVDEVDDADLLRNAIRGMVEHLDPHSLYLGKDYLDSFNRSLQGIYGGVGLYIDQDRGLIRVVSPIDDSPAQRAGLKTNDFIVKIDEESTENLSVGDAANLMRGLAGTPVTLSIVRLSEETREDFEVVLDREEINSPSVRSALAGNGIGFVRISQFLHNNKTSEELAEALDGLYAENGGSLNGLIIDLRNNPGGDLMASICVASVFIERDKLIVSDSGRNKQKIDHKSSLSNCQSPERVDLLRKINIAVLVNNGSASASEILAGALQDNDRGVIVGTTTFGKASVQRIFNIEATDYKSAVKLTSARYYTPSGKSIHKIGIQPDLDIEYIPPVVEDNPQQVTANELDNLKNIKEKGTSVIPQQDNQFDEAYKILQSKAG